MAVQADGKILLGGSFTSVGGTTRNRTSLGSAARLGSTPNWQLSSLSLPISGQLRARGRTVGGDSSGLVESVASYNRDIDSDGLSDAWELTYWPTASGHEPLDDFDQDGYVNLLELALGLSPIDSNVGGLPPVTTESDYLTMTLTKQPGVTYEVQSAGSLLPALPDSFSATTTTVLINDSTTLKVRDNVLISTASGRFMRVKMTATP